MRRFLARQLKNLDAFLDYILSNGNYIDNIRINRTNFKTENWGNQKTHTSSIEKGLQPANRTIKGKQKPSNKDLSFKRSFFLNQ